MAIAPLLLLISISAAAPETTPAASGSEADAKVTNAESRQVTLTTLSGGQHVGQLRNLTASAVLLATGEGDREIPAAELMQMRFSVPATSAAGRKALLQVELIDGSLLACSQIRSSGKKATVTSPSLGSLSLSISAVRSIRFASSDTDLDSAWNELRGRQRNDDSLVIRKQNERTAVLDYIDGVMGDFDENSIKFLFDGDEISVKRERVFGIVFYRRETSGGDPFCRVELNDSSIVNAKAVSSALASKGEQFRIHLAAGPEVSVPFQALRTLDFSLSKVRYLSDLEPRDVKYTPYFDVVWEYRRDRNLDGGMLRLGNTSYARGLAIHSKTLLRYRIGTEYRRFQAVMGIDRVISDRNLGDVHVVFSGDGKQLLEADVRGADEPRLIDLDVSGVRDFEILVDFGADLDIADHLDLADARFLK